MEENLDKKNHQNHNKLAPNQPWIEVGIVSMSLIFITSYAPFTIAALLQSKFPTIALETFVAVVFLSMGIATIISGFVTKTGLIVAPAVGLATFVNQTLPANATPGQGITPPQLLLASMIAAAIALGLSLVKFKSPRSNSSPGSSPGVSYRQLILDALPSPVKVGVRGGIGALLAAAAIHALQDVKKFAIAAHTSAVLLFVFGVALLLCLEIVRSRLGKERKQSAFALVSYGLAGSGAFFVPLLMFILLYLTGSMPLPDLAVGSPPLPAVPLRDLNLTLDGGKEIQTNFVIILCFTIVILFIFITDIPGSPYDILRSSGTQESAASRINASFVLNSAVSFVNPLVGLFTSVYYAENHIAIRDDQSGSAKKSESLVVTRPEVAWTCGTVFFLLGLVFSFVRLDQPVALKSTSSAVIETGKWLSVCVAPTLFYLGVRLTARAISLDLTEHSKLGSSNSSAAYFLPTALTIILTHFVGFELALPIGILYYCAARAGSGEPLDLVHATLITFSLIVAGVLGFSYIP